MGSYINQVTIELNSSNSIGLKMNSQSTIYGAFLDFDIWYGHAEHTYTNRKTGTGSTGLWIGVNPIDLSAHTAAVDKNSHSVARLHYIEIPSAIFYHGDIRI
jgi:hypothetical protein